MAEHLTSKERLQTYRQIIKWDDLGNFAQPCMEETSAGLWVKYEDARYLTAELEALKHDIERHLEHLSNYATELAAAQETEGRLRAALLQICDRTAGLPADQASLIASKALAGHAAESINAQNAEKNIDRPKDRPAHDVKSISAKDAAKSMYERTAKKFPGTLKELAGTAVETLSVRTGITGVVFSNTTTAVAHPHRCKDGAISYLTYGMICGNCGYEMR